MDRTTQIWITIGVVVASLLILALLTRAFFFSFIDNYEFAYKFDSNKGEMYPLVNEDGTQKQGYVFKWPIIQSVHTIDTRPMQVCINANSRVLNCKLVQFDPSGFETFVAWHGRGDYSQMGLEQILMSYAYDPSQKEYPFLKILKELKNQDTETNQSLPNKQENEQVHIEANQVDTIGVVVE